MIVNEVRVAENNPDYEFMIRDSFDILDDSSRRRTPFISSFNVWTRASS